MKLEQERGAWGPCCAPGLVWEAVLPGQRLQAELLNSLQSREGPQRRPEESQDSGYSQVVSGKGQVTALSSPLALAPWGNVSPASPNTRSGQVPRLAQHSLHLGLFVLASLLIVSSFTLKSVLFWIITETDTCPSLHRPRNVHVKYVPPLAEDQVFSIPSVCCRQRDGLYEVFPKEKALVFNGL